jgi:uncharacterized lipoprotein YddW (UPF0748 family)
MFGFLWLLLAAATLAGSATADDGPPEPTREFRGAWIATVANIDWPTKPGLAVDEQKQQLIDLLDAAVAMKLNAVVFQVRPACDAMYASQLEPWSEFLTGTQGVAPAEGFDPLEFAIDEAHRRGIELHAWFNPFRASHPTGKSPLADSHVANTHPDWVVDYGVYKWLNPGVAAARRHSIEVMLDVVRRYDIDGVHLDDYFYPYPVNDKEGQRVEFPDAEAYEQYVAQNAAEQPLSRDDWRRNNVNLFIEQLASEIRSTKPAVRFGVSPFGIYRPGTPPGIAGFDPYAQLYADAKLWLNNGWVDYMAPQLYWPIEQRPQSFPVLLDWWRSQNTKQRHLWPGLYTSQLASGDGGKGWRADEIVAQIELTRRGDDAPGHIHFSIKALVQNRDDVATRLAAEVYSQAALVPACQSVTIAPSQLSSDDLQLQQSAGGTTLRVRGFDMASDRGAVVQWRNKQGWQQQMVSALQPEWSPTEGDIESTEMLFVRRVSRTAHVGPVCSVSLADSLAEPAPTPQ